MRATGPRSRATKAPARTTATLELLDVTGKEVLGRVRLDGLTLSSQTRPGPGTDADSASNIGLEVEFQCSALRIDALKK